MLVNFPGVEFFGPHTSLEKERKIPVCECLFVLHKTPHKEILRPGCRGRQGNVPQKRTDANAFFCVLVAIFVIVAKAPFYFSMTRTVPFY